MAETVSLSGLTQGRHEITKAHSTAETDLGAKKNKLAEWYEMIETALDALMDRQFGSKVGTRGSAKSSVGTPQPRAEAYHRKVSSNASARHHRVEVKGSDGKILGTANLHIASGTREARLGTSLSEHPDAAVLGAMVAKAAPIARQAGNDILRVQGDYALVTPEDGVVPRPGQVDSTLRQVGFTPEPHSGGLFTQYTKKI